MADEGVAKAEKLAAAKKRFEELKKKKGKKGGKGAAAAAASTSASSSRPATPIEKETVEDELEAETPTPAAAVQEEKAEPEATEAVTEAPATEGVVKPEPPPTPGTEAVDNETPGELQSAQARAASIQARRASQSHYRRPSINATDILRSANKSPLSPTDVPDIYHRQAETISKLTEDNEKLAEDLEKLKAKGKRLAEIEAEKDKLQEQLAEVKEELRGVKGRIDDAEAGKKTSEQEMEKMKSELEALNRQTSHLTSQVTAKDKTIFELRLASSDSSNSQDRESLTAKEDQIENMEIDLNKLRSELERTQKSLSTAEQSLKEKEYANEALQEQLSAAQRGLEAASTKISEEATQHSALMSQLAAAKEELEITKSDIKKKNAQITNLDKDHYTLKTMYRDAEAKSQESSRTAITKAREAQDLEDALAEAKRNASQLEAEREDLKIKLERALAENRKLTGGANASSDRDEVDELEDAERKRLRERVRALEEQLDAERKRQPHHEPQPPSATPTRHNRGMSMVSEGSFLSDDADFGELMKQQMAAARDKEEAAAEERKRAEMERLERIRDVKRGLEKWKGWRMDLTLVGGSPHGLGEMFEV